MNIAIKTYGVTIAESISPAVISNRFSINPVTNRGYSISAILMLLPVVLRISPLGVVSKKFIGFLIIFHKTWLKIFVDEVIVRLAKVNYFRIIIIVFTVSITAYILR